MKEVCSFGMLGVFDKQKLKVVVLDDADIVASSKRIKEDLLQRLPSTCQRLYMSSGHKPNHIKNVTEMTLLVDGSPLPRSIDHFFVRCSDVLKHYVLKCTDQQMQMEK